MTNQEIPTPIQLLSKISRTDEYIGEISGSPIENMSRDEKVLLRARAFGAGALKVTQENTSRSGYMNREAQFSSLIGGIHSYIESSISMETDKQDGTYRRSEHLDDIKNSIVFNNGLSEVIDQNPKMNAAQLANFLDDSFVKMYGQQDREYFNQRIDEAIWGMKHETASKQILNYIDDISWTSSTVAQELETGADIIVAYKGVNLGIDIKASESAAERINSERMQYSARKTLAVWSHAYAKDFNGTFRIPENVAKQRASAFEQDLAFARQNDFRFKTAS